jgi:hypothetical protein
MSGLPKLIELLDRRRGDRIARARAAESRVVRWVAMIPTRPAGVYAVADRLLAGPYPGDADPARATERLRSLEAAGVTVFVDLTKPGEGPPYAHALSTARHERRPIADFDVTTPQGYRDVLDLVDAARAHGDGVYLHCLGGRGRTGTVVGCWLVRHGLDDGDALARIEALRAGLPEAAMPSPETGEQRNVVRGWARGA